MEKETYKLTTRFDTREEHVLEPMQSKSSAGISVSEDLASEYVGPKWHIWFGR